MLMMVAMVMAMAKIFAFRFYISKLPINRLRGRYVNDRRNYREDANNLQGSTLAASVGTAGVPLLGAV